MTTQVQRRRGTTVQHSTFTGAEGELTVDTTKDTAVVHDGSTAGGIPLAREDLDNVSSSDVVSKLSGQTVSVSSLLATTLSIGGTAITSTAAELNKLDGFTGTKDDLNYAKDLRATGVTSTEYDYLDGVTSNIQTQLDGKASTDLTNADITRHSIRPSLLLDFANSKQLDPRITFSRASTGTYYDGKTFAKAEENLLTRSQEFDNATWTPQNASVNGNATTAPDGTTTADEIIEDGTAGIYHWINDDKEIGIGIFTFSCYLKANTRDYGALILRTDNGAKRICVTFDLVNGIVVDTVTSGSPTSTDSAISDAGNGWYRCSVTIESDDNDTAIFLIGPHDDGTNTSINAQYDGDGSSSIYAWGAQLEQRDSVTAYTPTTTQPITNYIPVLQTAAAGTARFDHDLVTGESKGLLIEEQRTNVLTYSEDFSNAAWTKVRSSVTANTIVAPDGTLTGYKHIPDTQNNANHNAQRVNLTVSATQHTLSVYAKQGEYSFIQMSVVDSISYTKQVRQVFDLLTGATGNKSEVGGYTVASASITPVGNGWYRCTLVTSTLDANSTTRVEIQGRPDNSAVASYTGDGYSGIYIWGAQLEAGAFPTSYIKTTSAQATRNADAASMTGTNFSSWYRQDEGTLYLDFNQSSSSTTSVLGGTADGSFNNTIYLNSPTATAIQAFVRYNNVSQTTIGFTSYNKGSDSKIGLAYAFNDLAFSLDGATPATDTSANIAYQDRLAIGSSPWNIGGNAFGGTIKKIAYYPTRLTNAELQALTEE